jgi:hypothetical protein
MRYQSRRLAGAQSFRSFSPSAFSRISARYCVPADQPRDGPSFEPGQTKAFDNILPIPLARE